MEKSEENKGVDKSATPPAAVTDDKGVPWENRAKEFERKLSDAQARLQELETRRSEPAPAPADEEKAAEMKKQKILEFVEDPEGYIERRLVEREWRREEPQAVDWLKTQGMTDEDKPRISQIIKEHGISAPSPMARAKAAWKILRSETLEKEFSSKEADRKREDSVTRSMPDGSSRSTPTKTGPKRAELVAQLRDASRSGDMQKEIQLINLLEDVRE